LYTLEYEPSPKLFVSKNVTNNQKVQFDSLICIQLYRSIELLVLIRKIISNGTNLMSVLNIWNQVKNSHTKFRQDLELIDRH